MQFQLLKSRSGRNGTKSWFLAIIVRFLFLFFNWNAEALHPHLYLQPMHTGAPCQRQHGERCMDILFTSSDL